jgi:hypothetical protein
MSACAYAKSDWGRLFYSEQERQRPVQKIDEPIVYHGFIQGAKATYWINDEMRQTLPSGVLRREHQLLIQQGQEALWLDPGEQIEIQDNVQE